MDHVARPQVESMCRDNCEHAALYAAARSALPCAMPNSVAPEAVVDVLADALTFDPPPLSGEASDAHARDGRVSLWS